ncbi:MAG: hypothetical protein AB8B69_04765 [Chitinophagales bacterium]
MRPKITRLTTRWLYSLYGISLFLASIGQINAQCTPTFEVGSTTDVAVNATIDVCDGDGDITISVENLTPANATWFGNGLTNKAATSVTFNPSSLSGEQTISWFVTDPTGSTCNSFDSFDIKINVESAPHAGDNGTASI